MKFRDYLGPAAESADNSRFDGIINLLNTIEKSKGTQGETGKGQSIGIDTIVNSWVRQQFSYREQLIEDLLTIAKTVSEVASPILHIRNEAFRRGFAWEALFNTKCEDCGWTSLKKVDVCEHCEGTNILRPDEGQLVIFKEFVKCANTLDEGLESVLKQVHFSVNAIDDAYLYIRKEYKSGGIDLATNKETVRSRPIEIRHLRPSGVELDLDTQGFPHNSHWLCVFHRDNPISDTPGICTGYEKEKCGRELVAASYKFKHRGKFVYYLKNEVCHIQKFYPSESYGFSPILSVFEKALTIIGMDKCYDGETEVLTRSGWKFFKDVTKVDLVATMSKAGFLEFQNPTETNTFIHKGEMYSLESRSVNLLTTPHHRMLVRMPQEQEYSFKEAWDIIGQKMYFRRGDLKWEAPEQETFTLPGCDMLPRGKKPSDPTKIKIGHLPDLTLKMDDFLKFLGYYLTEGHRIKGTTGVALSQNKGEKQDQIWEDVTKLPFDWHLRQTSMACSDARLANYVAQFGKAKDKFIPEELRNLSTRQVKILFDALMLGDGNYGNRFTTISPLLRDQMMELSLKLGLSCSYHTENYTSEKSKARYKNAQQSFILFFSTYSYPAINYAKQQDKMIPWEGQVYCVEVPNTTLIVRRHGKVVISGNTIYRYFFERKLPASLLMVATDDTDSIRRVRADILAQIRNDPDYIPIVGYSAGRQTGARGRVDMVRLFHNLQEMDYLPVRQEIRERIAALWGLPPLWQAEQTGSGGLSGQSQQLVQFSRVVEADQRLFNEKVIPFLMDAFGITDWKMTLRQPEEKAESTRIMFAQQRASIASMVKQLGFEVEVKEGVESIDNLDFKVSGRPDPAIVAQQEAQQAAMAAQSGGTSQGPTGGTSSGGMPPALQQAAQNPGGNSGTPEQGNPAASAQPGKSAGFQLSEGKGWGDQLFKKGYPVEQVFDIQSKGEMYLMTFVSKSEPHVAIFHGMQGLMDVYKLSTTLHTHGSYPPHDKAMKHRGTLADNNPRDMNSPLNITAAEDADEEDLK